MDPAAGCEAVWQRGYSDSGCMLIMGRGRVPGDHSSLSVSTGTGIFCTAEKNELFAAAIKTVFSKWETLSLKSVQKL